jgi:integrase
MIASGASDVQVANQMGHSKVETTKNVYGKAAPVVTDTSNLMDDIWGD